MSEIISSIDLKESVHILGMLFAIGLGCYNLYSSWKKDRVRIDVLPKSARAVRQLPNGKIDYLTSEADFDIHNFTHLSIKIVNKSNFRITVEALGFQLKKKNTHMAVMTEYIEGGTLPRRMEPRESISAYMPLNILLKNDGLSFITSAYIKTQCGSTHYGSSGALKQFVKFMRLHENRLHYLGSNLNQTGTL